MFRTRVTVTLAALLVFLSSLAGENNSTSDKPVSTKPVEAKTWVTRHRMDLSGRRIEYTATVGTIVLKDEKDAPRASIFYTAYTLDGVKHPDERPIMFCFNGGPGSSSVWLHLGVFGPKRVEFADAEYPAPPSYDSVDNEDTLLATTDMVFIDPVGTGFSEAEGDAKGEDFFSVDQDTKSVSDFIYRYLSQNSRWNSPRFLGGESYGTTRAAKVARHLQVDGVDFNGLVMVSPALSFQALDFVTGNDLPYITFLPTYAATAWYHDALVDKPDDLEAFLAEVRQFAESDYASALMMGDRLGDPEKRRIAGRISRYTGLDTGFVLNANLRVSIFRFTKELLRDRRRTVGRLDSRYLGIDSDAAGESIEQDPSYAAIRGPYTTVINDYLRHDLGVDVDRRYEILSGEVLTGWDWGKSGRSGYVNASEDLRQAMSTNIYLKIYVANGYYDLATPFFATEYAIDHLGLEPELRGNISMSYFPAGHMMYSRPPSRHRLRDEVIDFIGRASKENRD